jgi:hypothetical protein
VQLSSKKQLQNFTTEDLRILVWQEIGLYYLIPLAIEALTNHLFAEGDRCQGDLLQSVLNVNTKFWAAHTKYWLQLNDLIKDKRKEIKGMQLDVSNFDQLQLEGKKVKIYLHFLSRSDLIEFSRIKKNVSYSFYGQQHRIAEGDYPKVGKNKPIKYMFISSGPSSKNRRTVNGLEKSNTSWQ